MAKITSFIRRLKCLKGIESEELVETDISEPTMLAQAAAAVAHADIEMKRPYVLKKFGARFKVKKSHLYNLTPQQLELLELRKKTVLVLGAAGTGKTIITKLKLLELLLESKEHERIAIFIPENMRAEYRSFLEENTSCLKEEQVNLYSLSGDDFIRNLLMELQAGANIFIDDSQHFYQFQRMFEIKDKLTTWRHRNPERLLWITIDWLQFLIKGPLIVKELVIPKWLFPESVFHLDLVMRNTSEIMKFTLLLQAALYEAFRSSDIPQDQFSRGIILPFFGKR